MIPKVIHYCWFGNGEKSTIIKDCIRSWKEKCPDYEIIEWNESNFDINICKYTKLAYDNKLYAFVSDFARLWIIFNYGGHYLDTDVELRTSLDVFNEYDGWFAADTIIGIATGLGFGSIKGSSAVKCMLDDYYSLEKLEVCVGVNTQSLKNKYPKMDIFDKTQVIDNNLFLSYIDYPKYAVHYYTATWKDEEFQKKRNKEILNKKHGKKSFEVFAWKIKTKLRLPAIVKYIESHDNLLSNVLFFLLFDFLDYGLFYYLKRFCNKIITKFK